jgi:putative membrane protein
MSTLARKIFLAAVAACALIAVATSPHAQEAKKPEAKKQAAKKPAAKGLSAQEAKYLRELSRRNLGEVHYSKTAAGKALTPEVKEFAQKMAAHHAKTVSELGKLAKAKGIDPQASLSKKQQEGMKKVQAAKGTGYDRAYLEQMVKDHQAMLEVTQAAAKSAKDPQFKALLDKSLPEIEQHLGEAKRILTSRPF